MNRNLIDYLPQFIKNYREIQAIMDAEQNSVVDLWCAIENIFNDQYISISTENGIKRWESILGITSIDSDALNERKNKIIMRLGEQLPYTRIFLYNHLENVCGPNGFCLLIFNEKYRVTVKLSTENSNMRSDVLDLLNRVLPCNLSRNVVIYNTWEIVNNSKTWGNCSNLSWNQLREDVL